MCLDADGILEKRYEGTESRGRPFVLNPPNSRHAHVHVHARRHPYFFALSTKSLLQKGESGQKTGEPDNALIKTHFNIPPLQRRVLNEGSGSGDETR